MRCDSIPTKPKFAPRERPTTKPWPPGTLNPFHDTGPCGRRWTANGAYGRIFTSRLHVRAVARVVDLLWPQLYRPRWINSAVPHRAATSGGNVWQVQIARRPLLPGGTARNTATVSRPAVRLASRPSPLQQLGRIRRPVRPRPARSSFRARRVVAVADQLYIWSLAGSRVKRSIWCICAETAAAA